MASTPILRGSRLHYWSLVKIVAAAAAVIAAAATAIVAVAM